MNKWVPDKWVPDKWVPALTPCVRLVTVGRTRFRIASTFRVRTRKRLVHGSAPAASSRVRRCPRRRAAQSGVSMPAARKRSRSTPRARETRLRTVPMGMLSISAASS